MLRHRRLGAFAEKRDIATTFAPMDAGSVIEAVAGGLMVGFFPAAALKLVLSVILILSAAWIFRGRKAPADPPQ